MTKEVAGHDTVDFESPVPTLTPGSIRTHGANFIVHTDAGEVLIPMLSVLGSVEGAQSISIDDPRFVSKDLEGALSELRGLINHGSASAQMNVISPVQLYNVAPNGFNFNPKGPAYHSLAFLPAQATHARIRFYGAQNNGDFFVGWVGLFRIDPNYPDVTWLNFQAGPGDITVLLPLDSNRKIRLQHTTNSSGNVRAECSGWMEIPGVTVPPDFI